MSTSQLGTVILASPLSHRFFTLFAAFAATAVLGLLFFGTFTRTAPINGWLVPQQGLLRVFAPQAGVVTALYVKEGARVHKGERLLTLSTELQSTTVGATQAEIARRLAARRESLLESRRQQEQLSAQQIRSLAERLATLRLEREQLEREIDAQQTRLKLAELSLTRLRTLRERGFISEQQLQDAEGSKLEQSARLQALQRQRVTMLREQQTLEGEQKDLPLKSRVEIASIEREIAAVEQELAQAEARREIVIVAPEDGMVTAIQAEPGGFLNSTVPLLSIVPAGATLEAQLYGPSRAIGFVRPGQQVLLRYQAYPYQKFGHYAGIVDTVSRTAINPAELPPQLAGLTSLYGNTEPVYRITVSLASQTITAYGQAVPLQPGMQLEANIALERRRLIEWVLEPLFTLTGKWQG